MSIVVCTPLELPGIDWQPISSFLSSRSTIFIHRRATKKLGGSSSEMLSLESIDEQKLNEPTMQSYLSISMTNSAQLASADQTNEDHPRFCDSFEVACLSESVRKNPRA